MRFMPVLSLCLFLSCASLCAPAAPLAASAAAPTVTQPALPGEPAPAQVPPPPVPIRQGELG